MNLAALLDLGIEVDYLIQNLSKLKLDTEYELNVRKDNKKGINGTRVDVLLKHDYEAPQEMVSDNIHIPHTHTYRNLKDIKTLIMDSSLDDNIKRLSLAIFMVLAEAESKVHRKPLNEVHFHEVGAVDSIIDIVGAAICLNYLKVDKIMASPVQVGGGFVKCAHGILPVPAPATIEILKDIPVKSGLVPFETTTPTGAAILAVNVIKFTPNMDLSVEKIGYGIGHRELEIPNILRVYLGLENRKEKKSEQYNDTNI
jgi:uncharacterized protein (TIGR00299 family) protein